MNFQFHEEKKFKFQFQFHEKKIISFEFSISRKKKYFFLNSQFHEKKYISGCVNERLNRDHPKELVHEELKHHLMQGDDGKPIPFQLQVHLEKIKRQYLSFIRQMQVCNTHNFKK